MLPATIASVEVPAPNRLSKLVGFFLRGACIGLAALGALAVGCQGPQSTVPLQRFEYQQPHMGTLFRVTLYASNEPKAREGSDAAFAKIAALDQMMTDYDPESELMRLCQRPVGEPTEVSSELFDVLQESQRIARLTDGPFDVTIGPVVRLWRRARRAETLPTPEQLTRALASVGWWKLKLEPRTRTVTLTVRNMQLDLGGIAKGYAADQALGVLKQHGLSHALVAASGDVAVGDPPPGERCWRIEIGEPAHPVGRLARVLFLKRAAVSTSGDAEQFVEIDGKRYSHIVDPRTGIGLTGQLQATVIGRRATDTDAFATAVSVLGVEQGLALIRALPNLEAVLTISQGGKSEQLGTPGAELISDW